MLTKGAVEDLIYEHLSRADRSALASAGGKKPASVKRTFISDWELRRLYKPGSRSVAVPANAILSPLSLDWLDYNGVKVVRN